MAPGWLEVSTWFTGDCYFPLLLAYFTHWLQDTEEKNLWDPVQRASQSVYPGMLTLQWIASPLFTQGRQEEELVMAKAKVEEVTKKLALVKPDSIVLKNKEPRSVI